MSNKVLLACQVLQTLCFLFNFSKQRLMLGLVDRSDKVLNGVQALLDLVEVMLVVVLDARVGDVLDGLHPLCDLVELMFDGIRVVNRAFQLLQLLHLVNRDHDFQKLLDTIVNTHFMNDNEHFLCLCKCLATNKNDPGKLPSQITNQSSMGMILIKMCQIA